MRGRRRLRGLTGALEPGEKLVASAPGRHQGRRGWLALTDRRLVFVTRRGEVTVEVPVRRLWVPLWLDGIRYGELDVFAGGAIVAAVEWVPVRDGGRLAAAMRQAVAQSS